MRIFSTTALVSVLGTAAMADGLTYGQVTFDYNQFESGPFEYSLTTLEGEIEYQVGQILLTAEAFNETFSDDFGNFSYQRLGAGAGYMITPEVLFGAGLQYFTNGSFDETAFEVYGQFQNEQFAVAANIFKFEEDDGHNTTVFGEATIAPGVTLGAVVDKYSEFDDSTYFLSAEYEGGPILARVFLEGNTEYDGGIIGARGTYDINDMFRASVGLAQFTGDFAPDATFVAIGGGVQVTDGLWFDATYGTVTGDDVPDDVSRLQAVLTFELGDRMRVDRRMVADILDDLDTIGGGGPS